MTATFKPRRTEPLSNYSDPDGLKLYFISASGAPVDHREFLAELAATKQRHPLNWRDTPAFAIFHAGATMLYLVVCWWGNGNELFTTVSVREADRWIEDPSRYSFCIWDLEVIWFERNSFICHLYSGKTDLHAYRADFLQNPEH